MRKALLVGTVLGAAGLAIWQFQAAAGSEEEPNYRVVSAMGKFEIRQYPPLIAAQVDVPFENKDDENEAFKILAGYIFGKNRLKAKIAMTVPVTEQLDRNEKIPMTVPVTENVTGGSLSMRFFLPSKYTMDTLPEPLDKRIKLLPVEPQKFAVIRFSGLANEKSIKRQTELLENFMQEQSLKQGGAASRAFYNPPWTLPFLRRNEVWIPVQDAT